MEILSNQGLLISPNVAIPAPIQNSEIDGQVASTVEDHHHVEDKRKSWKPVPGENDNNNLKELLFVL
jgi:hypothetical protein